MTGRLRVFMVLLSAVAMAIASCGGEDTQAVVGLPPPPAPFTLYVSNQSFEHPTVGITISMDGEVVVDQDFDVEGQHNWISFEPDVSPGRHTLRAVSETGAELTAELELPASGEPRWAVVDHWFHSDEGAGDLTLRISDEPIGFE